MEEGEEKNRRANRMLRRARAELINLKLGIWIEKFRV